MAKGLRSAGAIQFFVSDGGSPTSWEQLGEVVDLQEGARLGVAEASNLDSAAAEYIAALAENGLTLTIMYRPDIAVQQTLKNARRVGTRLEFKILFVASAITTVFFGFVTDFDTLAKVGKMLVGDLTIKMDTRETETIPVEPLTPSTSKVLLHFDGLNGATTTTDEYGNTVGLSAGTMLKTDQQKFGSASYWAHNGDGVADKCTVTGFGPLATDWTAECFVRWPSVSWSADRHIGLSRIENAANALGAWLGAATTSDVGVKYLTVRLALVGGSGWDVDHWLGIIAPSANTWHHFALTRDSSAGYYYAYMDGALITAIASALAIRGLINQVQVGAQTQLDANLSCYIDEYRISDTCKYQGGAPFTPPTAPFTS